MSSIQEVSTDTHANQQHVRDLSVLDHNEASQACKKKPIFEAEVSATTLKTSKQSCKFFSDLT
jgi:hypothetical protein